MSTIESRAVCCTGSNYCYCNYFLHATSGIQWQQQLHNPMEALWTALYSHVVHKRLPQEVSVGSVGILRQTTRHTQRLGKY